MKKKKIDRFAMEHYFVDPCILAKEWITSTDKISCVIKGGETEDDHQAKAREVVDRIVKEHDEAFTSWVFVGAMYKNVGGYNPHISVAQFRVRDAY